MVPMNRLYAITDLPGDEDDISCRMRRMEHNGSFLKDIALQPSMALHAKNAAQFI
jgi:hypothetical protein